MTALLEKAYHRLERLPEDKQNEMAAILLVVLDDTGTSPSDEASEAEWDVLVSSEQSQRVMEKMAAEALADEEAGRTMDYDPSDLLE